MKYLQMTVISLLVFIFPIAGASQQIADPSFKPVIKNPAFAFGTGPIVAVDAGHHNFHTIKDRFSGFAEILRGDGYKVIENDKLFSEKALENISMLVIANPGSDDESSWKLPTPSAFKASEIRAVKSWVESGGSLFLIVDHMPAAGAAIKLAEQFGVHLTNGYTYQQGPKGISGDLFTRIDGTLLEHPITQGRSAAERVDSIMSFVGQGFQSTVEVETVLQFDAQTFTLLPVEAGVGFDKQTPRVHSGGWQHGIVLRFGEGRVAIFGEAAMFSAQVAGKAKRPMGLNHPRAPHNQQFLLNIVHWLSGLLDQGK